MEQQNITKRNSAIEMLRILAMLLIVLSHACIHSRFDRSSMDFGLNRLFVQWGGLGDIGVVVFVLISGYFLCQKQTNYRSVLKLLLQVWFWSVVLFLVSWLGFGYSYSLKGYLQVFFPMVFQEYWFFTAYIVLALLSPVINLLFRALNRRQLEKLLLLLLVLWCVVPTFTLQNLFGDTLAQMVMFYLMGGYFRLYPENFLQNRKVRWAMVLVPLLLLMTSTVAIELLSARINLFAGKGRLFYSRTSVFVVACAVGLFSVAVYSKPFTNRFINALASCTFGVYLIHDNPAIREILWLRIMKHAEYASSPVLIVRIILSALIVYAVCTALEYLRICFWEGRLLSVADRMMPKRLKKSSSYEI